MKNIDIDKDNIENIDIDIDKDNIENIAINIVSDKTILKDIVIDKDNLGNIDIDKDYLENPDIDIDIDKDVLGKKIIFFNRFKTFSCFFDEILISIVDISAFFEISMKY